MMRLFMAVSGFAILHSLALSASTGCDSTTEVPFAEGCVDLDSAYVAAHDFLMSNLPSWDVANAASLGFSLTPDTADGLDDGVATLGLNLSLATQMSSSYPWSWDLPQSVFNEYVATYAHVNEARNNWRPLLAEATAAIIASADEAPTSVTEVVDLVNANLWHTASSGLVNNVTFKVRCAKRRVIRKRISNLSNNALALLFASPPRLL